MRIDAAVSPPGSPGAPSPVPGLPGGGIAVSPAGGPGPRRARRHGAGRCARGAAPPRGRAGWGQAHPRGPAPGRRAAASGARRPALRSWWTRRWASAGHAAALLAEHPQLTLVGLDRDPEALALAGRRLAAYADRTHLVHAVYDQIADVLAELGLPRVDGVLFDLGVSSLQLDADERGFSYSRDADLDMRMDPSRGPTAADVLNTYPVPELARILREYGEERFAGADRRGGRRGGGRRRRCQRSGELVELLYEAVPAASRRTGGHPAKRTFQALRIEVNGELDALRRRAARRSGRARRRRPDRRAGLPLAGGPHRQARAGGAVDARARPWACRSSCPGTGRRSGC